MPFLRRLNRDTDSDGSTDWAEVLIGLRGGLPEGLAADPLNPDTDGNGVLDGWQLDLDLDQVADAIDPHFAGQQAAQDGAVVNWERPPGFQFAVFPTALDEAPYLWVSMIDLSDNGTMLFNAAYDDPTIISDKLVVDGRLGVHDVPASIEPLTEVDGDFQSFAISLMGDRVLGKLSTVNPQTADLENHESLWNPMVVAPANPYTPSPLNGYQDALRDDRGDNRILFGWDTTSANRLLGTGGYLEGSSDGVNVQVRLEGGGNAVTDSGYWRFDPANQHYSGKNAFPESSAGKSATLTGLSEGATPATHTWNLVAGGTSLLVSQDGGGFVQSKIDLSGSRAVVGISNQGWVASAHEIWNKDRWAPLTRHLGGKFTEESTLLYMLDTGLAAARLKVVSGELGQPAVNQTCLLVPITADGVPAAPNPAGTDSLALGVDRISMLASGGAGRIDRIGIMTPIGSSRSVRLLTPASADMELKLACDVATFTPDTLSVPDVNLTVAGKDPAGETIPLSDGTVTLTHQTSGQNATNAPIVFKRMKPRTVKVALHKVFSVDAGGNTAAPLHVPTKPELETYLNNVYGPQVNLSFEVTLYDEGTAAAGIDFDQGFGDNRLDANNAWETTAATPNAKADGANPTANIDVWVIGGDVSLEYSPPLSVLKRLAYGYQVPLTQKIIVDGNLLLNNPLVKRPFDVGKEMEHLLHTIAHEIGHVMTDDSHPGDEGYLSKLEWEGGKDPYLKKRLMCSGESDNDTNPGTGLIKSEWDRIEAWLRNEEANQRL